LAFAREYFAIYADTCFASFGDRVKNWMTVNEPLQTAINGYDTGIFAPGRRENALIEPYLAAHHQILAHATAVSIYRNKYKVQGCTHLFLLKNCILQVGLLLFCAISFILMLSPLLPCILLIFIYLPIFSSLPT